MKYKQTNVFNNCERSTNKHTHLLAIPFGCSGNIGLYEITVKMNTQDFRIVFFYRIGNLFEIISPKTFIIGRYISTNFGYPFYSNEMKYR